MTQAALFALMGAPLANTRWSMGSLRKDSVVLLKVWQDQTCSYDGAFYMQLTFDLEHESNAAAVSYEERLRHVELLKNGATCYMIMCEAVDVNAVPRKVKDFNDEEVFPGGRVIELNNHWWIELRRRVPVKQVAPPAVAVNA